MSWRRQGDVAIWLGTAVAVCGMVAVLVLGGPNAVPFVGIATVGLAAALLAFVSPYFRLLAFVGGALTVMQSDTLAAAKPAYLVFVLVAAVFGMFAAAKLSDGVRAAFRPAFRGAWILLAFVVAVAVGTVVAGEDPSRVVRDATTYVMIGAAPFVAADACRVGSLRRARTTVGVFVLVGAAGFAAFWLNARGVGALQIDRFVMFSLALTASGFSLGTAYGLVRRNLLWLGIGVACLLAVLVTGTRTGLVLLIGVAAMLGRRRKGLVSAPGLIVGAGAVAAGVALVLPSVASSLSLSTFLDQRVASLANVFANGVSVDQSGLLRQRALQITLDTWSANPLFGVGFGHAFPNPSPLLPPADFQLDSAALVLAKFGIVGTAVLVVAAVMMFAAARRFAPAATYPAARSFGLICVALAFLGWPMEDKGFALSICLMFSLLGVEVREGQDFQTLEGSPSTVKVALP